MRIIAVIFWVIAVSLLVYALVTVDNSKDVGTTLQILGFFALLILGVLFWVSVGEDGRDRAMKLGEPLEAVIIEVEDTSISSHGLPQLKFTLEVASPDSGTARIELKERVPMSKLGSVKKGEKLVVKRDPEDESKIYVDWQA